MDPWLENFARAGFRRSGDTAHDLKTPLNVAVLNLELLRMRLRKLSGGEEDEKINGYARAIELELRRLGHIFDAFFLLSAPPKNEGEPAAIELALICADIAAAHDFAIDGDGGGATLLAHESRIRQAIRMFFEAAAKLFRTGERRAAVQRDEATFSITAVGIPEADEIDLTKVFKFYYTDPQGQPDLSLAAARLIAETYGGELSASRERDKVSLRLQFPLGEQ